MRGTWPAVAWFALAIFATAMLLRSLQHAGSLHPVNPTHWTLPRPAMPPQWHPQTTDRAGSRSQRAAKGGNAGRRSPEGADRWNAIDQVRHPWAGDLHE